MEVVGINYLLLGFQLLNIALLIAWLVLAVLAFRQLGRRNLSENQRLLWVALMIFVPLLGVLAFFLTKPGVAREGQGDKVTEPASPCHPVTLSPYKLR